MNVAIIRVKFIVEGNASILTIINEILEMTKDPEEILIEAE